MDEWFLFLFGVFIEEAETQMATQNNAKCDF